VTTLTQPGVGAPNADAAALPHRRLLSGLHTAPWVRVAYVGVGALAAVVYLFNLTISGFANTYYSAAALAASQSWSAWFFGSFDAANFITVDKPPLATMLMGLSVRLFGLSSWSVLLPEALCGVATVVVLFAVVRRSFGPPAAFIAGVVMALTPVAALIFRYNNPDALLTLLLVLAAAAFLRALEAGRLRWVLAAAVLVGLAFNTKYLQAYLVLPAFAITYLVAAPGSLRRRLGALMVALLAVIAGSGWWVLVVELLPAAARPFIGGSTNNSALDLVLGYDGLARIFGFGGGPGGGGGGVNFSGTAGLLRLFNNELGGQIAWLLPFSLVGGAAGLALRLRARRTDPARAAYLMWGLWLVTHALVFSFMTGIIHSYYAVALAPAIAALVGAGAVDLWRLRSRHAWGGLPLAAAVAISAVVAWQLLERSPSFAPGLSIAVLGGGLLAAVILSMPAHRAPSRTQRGAALVAGMVLLAGPASFVVDTMATAYSGGDPSAGPVAVDASGGPGGGGQPGVDGSGRPGGGPPGGGPGGLGGFPVTGTGPALADGGSSVDTALVSYLLANQDGATWIVATTSAQAAGSLELAAGEPVMAMGGFTGSDPAPTLDEFKQLVADGEVRYVLVSGMGGFGGPGAGGTTSQIDTWAESVGNVVDYGGSGSGTLYDVSAVAATLKATL
jgi:4-amino-4-deoxy-L-arabinose transferase-like glycosyltransferase